MVHKGMMTLCKLYVHPFGVVDLLGRATRDEAATSVRYEEKSTTQLGSVHVPEQATLSNVWRNTHGKRAIVFLVSGVLLTPSHEETLPKVRRCMVYNLKQWFLLGSIFVDFLLEAQASRLAFWLTRPVRFVAPSPRASFK